MLKGRFFGTSVPQNDRKKTVMPPNEMRIRHLPTPFRHAAKAGIPALAKASKSGRSLILGKNASQGAMTVLIEECFPRRGDELGCALRQGRVPVFVNGRMLPDER